MKPKQLSRIGEIYLEEAVMCVLADAHRKDESIGMTEIGHRSGIFSDAGPGAYKNGIVAGILTKLAKGGRVQRKEQDSFRSATYEIVESDDV